MKALILAGASFFIALPTAAMAQEQAGDGGAGDTEIVVTGYRASLAAAIRAKREAGAIVDSVSAEDVGKFPNTNVAEALTLVPGVTVDRQFGQGEKVSILGTDPSLNRTLLNGQTVASADWFILDTPGRTFNYALLAPQLVDRVDVYKSPEARIDEGSIGGTVNVLTRTPLALKPLSVAGSLGYLYNDRSKKGDLQGSAFISWRNEAATFGILASFQRAKDRLRRDGVESYGTIKASQWAGGNADNPVDSRKAGCTGSCASTLTSNLDAVSPNAFGTSYFEQSRERLSYSATAQWRPSEAFELQFDWLKIDATYNNLNQSMYAFQGNTWNSLDKLTDLTVRDGIVTKASFNNALSVLDVQYREAEMHSDTYRASAKWHSGAFNVALQGGLSDADGGTKRQVFLEFLNSASYTFDISGAPKAPGILTYSSNVQGSPGSFVTDPGWSGNTVAKPTTDKERYGQLDADIGFDGPIKKLLFGYKYRRHETAQRYAGIALSGLSAPASQFSPSVAPSNYLAGFQVNEQMARRFVISGPSMVQFLEGRTLPAPSIFAAAEFTAGNWEVDEDIHALYGQANFEVAGLRGNFGVRYVHTGTSSQGYVCASGTPCNTASNWRWQTTKSSYDNILPSVNVIADVRKDLIFRFAAAQVVARPNYADLTNYFWLSDGILTGGGGNPNLKPYKSNNVNVSLEWYFAPRSILSAEVFYKDISNYILNQTAPEQYFNQSQGRVTTYQISRPFNAGSAEVKGFAAAYQQELPLGFGLLANYTYSDGSGRDGADLPFNSRHQVSLSPFWEQGPVSLRGTYTWRSKYFTGVDRGDNMYVRGVENVDASLTYKLISNVSITASAMNLTDAEYYAYANTPALPRGVYRSGRKFLLSLNLNL
ncbi:TonB-dependent receptor [Sphingomonas trueperi]|uniref:TonB-dependent receptor n=1 Tax=Sphingomonas trueperi TaxID=53317 RepID=UPI000F1ACFA5